MMGFIGFAVPVVVAASFGAIFKPDDWFRGLRKPSWNPPDWIFAPVWALLYAAIACAGWLAWRDNGEAWSGALTFWTAQLLFNAAWSWLFFRRHEIALALADSSAMLVAIIGFMVSVAPINTTAAWLFVPYAAWVAFATVLNFTILRRNPQRSGDWRTEAP